MSNLSFDEQVDFPPSPHSNQSTELLENNDEISETAPLIPITKKKDTPLPKSQLFILRPILLFGLFGNVIGITLFGLSRSLIWAIITRSSCGILNGNIGVAKSMLGEITDKTNQAKAFSLFGFWLFSLTGFIVGYFKLIETHHPNSQRLGFSAAKLALTLACMGCVQLFSQFIIYPWLARRINIAKTYPFIWFSYIPIYLSFPTINKFYIFLYDKKIETADTIIWYILLPFLTIRFFLNVFSYTSSMLFINNSATPNILGTVNGIAQASASFVRTVGPALGGFLWSWSLTNNLSFPFDNYFAFVVLSIISLIGGYQSSFIPHNLSAANSSDK
ncbi:11253_t:CDS:2 [Diversispora eburnea]|uniref:11253_t:CDS:1 n=1 Tax=Diversispora eburnea TaxID=1213867 RepID=A0A9N9ANE4_9GLOM|nr:11253_t:CDS:2 [Diversispora eburnea]